MLLLLGVTGCRSQPPDSRPAGRTITVAAAASLQFALDEVLDGFRQKNPDITVKTVYGSSGNICAQLQQHAPFDLFLSADLEYPRRLVELGIAREADLFTYAVGGLALWVRRDSGLDVEGLGMRALLDPAVGKIAIANPRHAPYGRAAEAALRHAGLHEQVADRLVFGENIAQAAQYVESGAADAGIIGLSLAIAPRMTSAGRHWVIPADAHPQLEHAGIVISDSGNRPATEALRDYLLSDPGRTTLARFGFLPPER